MWQLILAMVIWGTLGLFVLQSGLGSIEIAFFRCLIGSIILAPYCWVKGFFSSKTFMIKLILPILLGGILIVLNWILLFQSFKLASITLGNVSYYMQPVFLVILGKFFFREDISLIKWVFILLTLVGVMMTMDISSKELHVNNMEIIGVGCALLAGFFYSIATIIAKKAIKTSPTMMTLLQLMIGTVVLIPFIRLNATHSNVATFFYIIILGLVHTVAAFILYYQSVKKLSTTTIAVISYVDPIVAIFTDVLFFNRELNLIQILGIGITLGGSYFVINPQAFKRLFSIKNISDFKQM